MQIGVSIILLYILHFNKYNDYLFTVTIGDIYFYSSDQSHSMLISASYLTTLAFLNNKISQSPPSSSSLFPKFEPRNF